MVAIRRTVVQAQYSEQSAAAVKAANPIRIGLRPNLSDSTQMIGGPAMVVKPKTDITMPISAGFKWRRFTSEDRREHHGHGGAGDNKTRDRHAKPNVADAQDIEGASLAVGGQARSGDACHRGLPDEFGDGNRRHQAGNTGHKEGSAPTEMGRHAHQDQGP